MAQLKVLSGEAARAYQHLTFPMFQPLLGGDDPTVRAIGAMDGLEPVGLVLAQMQLRLRHAEVLSIAVHPDHQGEGIGLQLLEAMEQQLVKAGMTYAFGHFRPDNADEEALVALLEHREWSEPEPAMLVMLSNLEKIATAPWLAPAPLPEGLELFPWAELTREQAERLHRAAQEGTWLPADVAPELQAFEPATSFGLRRGDEVVGWVLTTRHDDVTLLFGCSFVRKELQRTWVVLQLYRAVVERMRELGIPNGLWTIPLDHGGMAAFARRRMAPYCTQVVESCKSGKWFTQG